ncbi:MAG: tetratricopeptide repeat protein [Candidatus Fermentibacter sp.]|nr:tetratricopeptide repeat protein [Candidatus Fermentibacter sp.]
MYALLLACMTGAPPAGWAGACAADDWPGALSIAEGAIAADSLDADAWACAAIAAFRSETGSNASVWAGAALALDSLSPLAWAARGTLLSTTDPEAALGAFRRSLELDDLCIPAIEGMAGVVSSAGDYELSVDLLEGLLEAEPSYRPAFLPLIGALGMSGREEEALARASALSGLHPDYRALSLEFGTLLEEAGLPDSAMAVYTRAVPPGPSGTEFHRRIGLLHEDRGGFGAAIKSYREAIASDSTDSWAFGEIGWCFEAVGRDDLAMEWYMAGLDVDPGYSWAAYRAGLLMQNQGLPDSARTWFGEALAIDPAMTEAWVSLGLLDESEGLLEKAAADYRRALELDPSDAWTWGELGYVCYNLGSTAEAAAAYEMAVGIDSAYQWGWEQRGLLYEEGGEPGLAASWYRAAIEAAPQSAWLYGELGMLLEDAGEADSAEAVYLEALSIDSLYSFGLLRLARIERRTGSPEVALDYLERYMEASGDTGMALLESASIRRGMGEAGQADSLEALAMEYDPASAENLAWSLHYNGMTDEAVAAGIFACSKAPGDPVILVSICDMLSAAGRFPVADSLCRAAAGAFPGDPAVWRAWGTVLGTAEMYAEAEEALTASFLLDSASYETASLLGEALLFQDRYAEAEEWLERSLELDPEAVFSICYLGLIRERMGDPSGALDRYLEALRISPGYSYAEDRIRYVSDPSYDVDYWRTESRPFSASIWADLSFERGNGEESSYQGGAEASWICGPRGSRVDAEFRGNLEKVYVRERENSAWASLGMEYFLTGVLYAKAHGSWDRQPSTVRPWQVSSYTSIGYREWITDWLYVAPEVGAGMVTSQWYMAEKKTDDWTSYLSLGVWMNREDSLLPSLWVGAGVYLPPDDTDNYIANGNAEISFDAMDRVSIAVGCNLDYTNRPVIPTWEKLDSEVYSRISLSLF